MNVGRYLRGEDSHVGTSRITKSKELKMNEKIKKLAEQSGLWDILDQWSSEWEDYVTEKECGDQLEKFAELIVRESAEVVNYYHSRNEPVTSQQILRHFGIE